MAKKTTQALKLRKPLLVREDCGYKGGFRILLEPLAAKETASVHVWLKCPSGGVQYDFGLKLAAR